MAASCKLSESLKAVPVSVCTYLRGLRTNGFEVDFKYSRQRLFLAYVITACFEVNAMAAESFEYISEHIPEVAMDNRYATIPLHQQRTESGSLMLQTGYSSTRSNNLELSGGQFAVSYQTPLGETWSLQAMLFDDELTFSGGNVNLPMDPLFSRAIPLSLPADARFGDLQGDASNLGVGLFFARDLGMPCFGTVYAAFGLIRQTLHLENSRIPYQLTSGPDSGTTGSVDYSADYAFVTPVMSISRPIRYTEWDWVPRLTVALPLPRAGVQGRITGPGFDIAGDTANIGRGRHYGDFSVTLGLAAFYKPWGMAIDLGAMVSQLLLEPFIHKGIESNWIVSVSWTL